MKIYIAGKITNELLPECKAKFEQAGQELRRMGAKPVNPFNLNCPDHFTFEQCKPKNFEAIAGCDAIFMLRDWRNSPGARVELHEAMRLKLNLFFEQDNGYHEVETQVTAVVA